MNVSHKEYLKHVTENYKTYVKRHNKDFTLDGNMDKVISELVLYCLNDKRSNIPLHKNIYLYGDLGLGKTMFIQSISSISKLVSMYTGDKTKAFKYVDIEELYNKLLIGKDFDKLNTLVNFKNNLVIDELKESHGKVQNFGNNFFPINSLLSIRYNLMQRNVRTIIISNVPKDKMLDMFSKTTSINYSPRLYDRMSKGYSFIEIMGSNKR